MNSALVKIIAWIYLVLGVIGSIIMGNSAKDVFLGASGIAFTVSAVGIISTAGTAFVLFAISKIMENTEECMSKLYRLEHKPAQIDGASNSKMSLSAVTSKASGGEWRCPDCGKRNPTSIRTCKDCGYQK